MKVCPGCKQELNESCFNKNASRRDGLQYLCKECRRERYGRPGAPRRIQQPDNKSLKTCTVCKETKSVEEFSKNSNRCKPCMAEKFSKYIRTPLGRFSAAKGIAKRTGRKFTLGLEHYTHLMSLDCFYCGSDLEETGIGLDRMNSSGDYTPDNVVPCCWLCNHVKSDAITAREMCEYVAPAIQAIKQNRECTISTKAGCF